MLRPIGIALLCSGCAQVLGIDETSSSGAISVRLQRVSVGASVEFNPLDVGTEQPTFLVRDLAQPSGVRLVDTRAAESGRWVASTDAVEGVLYSYPDNPIPHLLWFPKFSGTDLRAYVTKYEHPNPQPAPSPPPNVTISVGLTSQYRATESFAVGAVGAWVQYSVPAPIVGDVVLSNATSYSAFQPFGEIGGSVGQITAQDVVALLRYESTPAGVVNLTGQLSVPAFDQTSDPMNLTGTLIPIGAGQLQSLGATIAAVDAAGRFTAQVPAIPPPVQSWRVDAAPGYALGRHVGFLLAAGPIAPDATAISATYANPFSPQWHPTVTYTAVAERTYNIGAIAIPMRSSLQAIAEAGPSISLNMAAGLPTQIAINGMPLTADGIAVNVDVKGPVYAEITSDRTENTLYEVTVVELSDTGIRTPVAVVMGIESRLQLPPGVLQPGRSYYLRVDCTAGGYTKATSGNLQTFALPVSHGVQDSAVFKLM